MAKKPPLRHEPDPDADASDVYDSPTAWFAVLERARLTDDHALADRAKRELERLGVAVRFARPRKGGAWCRVTLPAWRRPQCPAGPAADRMTTDDNRCHLVTTGQACATVTGMEHPTSLPGAPARIEADAIYTDGELRLMLGLPGATLARARRERKLRHTRQGRRLLYRGTWVLAWLEADADRQESVVRDDA